MTATQARPEIGAMLTYQQCMELPVGSVVYRNGRTDDNNMRRERIAATGNSGADWSPEIGEQYQYQLTYLPDGEQATPQFGVGDSVDATIIDLLPEGTIVRHLHGRGHFVRNNAGRWHRCSQTGVVEGGDHRWYPLEEFGDVGFFTITTLPGASAEADAVAAMKRRVRSRLLASGRHRGYPEQAATACVLLGLDSPPGEGEPMTRDLFMWAPNALTIDSRKRLFWSGENPEGDVRVGRLIFDRVPTDQRTAEIGTPTDLKVVSFNYTPPTYTRAEDVKRAAWELVRKMRPIYSWCEAPLEDLRGAGLEPRRPGTAPAVGVTINDANRERDNLNSLNVGSTLRANNIRHVWIRTEMGWVNQSGTAVALAGPVTVLFSAPDPEGT